MESWAGIVKARAKRQYIPRMERGYRLYVREGETVLWLCDWIIGGGFENPQFTPVFEFALRFGSFITANKYRCKPLALGYAPHIQ